MRVPQPRTLRRRAEGGLERARRGTGLWAPEEPALPCPTDGGILAPPLLVVTHLSRLGLCLGGLLAGTVPYSAPQFLPTLCYGPGGGPSRAVAQARAQPWRLWGPERREGGS